ncbi:MAG TPA: DUF370 domain-containing protein [Tepidimicrobium sp.]|nr:DUF370 domain-containing protein [Tepidimicrobium sp.]
MSIHIGENITIFKEDIIAIIDRKTVETSINMKRFIDNMIKDGNLRNNNIENARTYILTYANKTDNKKYNLYLSNISSITLFKRAKKENQIGG